MWNNPIFLPNINIRWQLFLATFIAVFIMVSLQMLGVRLPKLNNQHQDTNQIKQDVNIIDTLRPKLEQKLNTFNIKKGTSIVPIPVADAASEYNQAKAYGVLDFDSGEILAEKNYSLKLPIASLTKLMTAVVALDLVKYDDIFEVSQNAAEVEPTRMGVIPGQRLTLEELLNALLLTSANDAAEVIIEGVDKVYGDNIFIPGMNLKAKFLGMENSHFSNPQGYDSPQNYSSIEDLLILSSYALKNYPLITDIVKKDYQFYPANENHKQADLYNWNGLLGVYPGVLGVKIGNTDNARVTTVVLSEREGKKVLAVLLGAPGVLERDLWASQLLDLGFSKSNLTPVNITADQLKEKYASWRYWN